MADLEQNRQESLDFSQEEERAMDANTPLDNTRDILDFLHLKKIDIKEDFKETCELIKNGSEIEKERIKGKLLVYLAQAGENIDYDKTTIKVVTDKSGVDEIILTEKYSDNLLPGYREYILRNEGGDRYYTRLATKGGIGLSPNEPEAKPDRPDNNPFKPKSRHDHPLWI